MRQFLTMISKRMCCFFQEVVKRSLSNVSDSEEKMKSECWEMMNSWFGMGKQPNGKIDFNCDSCNSFYLYVENQSIDFLEREGGIDRAINKIGCCRSIAIIYGIGGSFNLDGYSWWLSTFKDIMCYDCDKKAKKFAIDSGFMKTIEKLMKEEQEKENGEKWDEFVKNNKPQVVLGEMLYFDWKEKHNWKTNLNWKLELWDEMGKAGWNAWNPSRREITDYFFW